MQNAWYYCKKYGRDFFILLLILFCIALIIYNFYKDFHEEKPKNDDEIVLKADTDKKEETDIKKEVEEQEVTEEKKIYVDIKGAVKTPGVYELKEGSIINDAITLAGGFNADAYKDAINLSKKVSDEMVIIIYTKKEAEKANKTISSSSNGTCKTSSYSIRECLDNNCTVIETDSNNSNETTSNNSNETSNNQSVSENKDTTPKLVNINTATVKELTSLSGIGDAKAEAIIKYRTEHGNFKTINDITKVSGIGDSIFAKIKDYITV